MSQEVVQIKPIVLFGISEHYKRKTIQLNSKDFLIMGCLYGTRDGLNLTISFSAPIRVTEDNRENKIEKEAFLKYFEEQDKLIRVDHPGNNLRNLEFIGVYLLRKNLRPTQQDEDIFSWLSEKGFENQRLILINFQGKHQIHVYKRQGKLIQVPFTNTTQSSQTICINGLSSKSKQSPYLKALQQNKNLMSFYNQKLITVRKQLQTINDPVQLRELNNILNSLKQLTEQKTVLQALNSAVVFNFAVALHLERKEIL